MGIRSSRVPALVPILLALLCGFAALASAQVPVVNRPWIQRKAHRNARHAQAMKPGAPAYGYKVLYSFCAAGGCGDGTFPASGLIQDAAGNLYGTTLSGGIFDLTCYGGGCGTVFKLDSSNNYTVLYSFCSALLCADGENPYASLVMDAAGNLYGTTSAGGASGGGTVFKVDTTGHETVLYSFCSAALCADGQQPMAGLIQDAAGSLYGTTYSGGAHGGGTVFKLDSTGQETVLYSFCSVVQSLACTDGQWPSAGLLQDAAGNFYGTTSGGGANHVLSGQGWGTVFKLDSNGVETALYNFCSAANCTDGSVPTATLIQDAAGNLYGTTQAGGANSAADDGSGAGTVFKLDSSGQETVLYSFCSAANCADGEAPPAGVIQDSGGNLYGTTLNGGISLPDCYGGSCGTVFKLDSTGVETVLYNFCSVAHCTDGEYPYAGLIEDAGGSLYGTTNGGGSNGAGSVFRFSTRTTATIILSASANPSYVGQSVTFSVTVSGTGVTPTGTVTFENDKVVIGAATLAGGQASFPTTFANKGTFSILASYSGDLNYNPVNSATLKQAVDQYTTSTALVSSLNPSIYGQSVTLTATVSSSGTTPTGTVFFKNGTTGVGSATLSGGVATITKSNFAAGGMSLTANYSGDTAHATSTSAALKQVVKKATTTTTLVSSVNPVKSGHNVSFTATVTSATTKATGTVSFMDGSTVLKTANLGAGKVTYNTTSLSVGSHNIKAVYAGTVDIGGSKSAVLVQTVD
jgi:uncharacterized repeat protein (TIGR03803 family)